MGLGSPCQDKQRILDEAVFHLADELTGSWGDPLDAQRAGHPRDALLLRLVREISRSSNRPPHSRAVVHKRKRIQLCGTRSLSPWDAGLAGGGGTGIAPFIDVQIHVLLCRGLAETPEDRSNAGEVSSRIRQPSSSDTSRSPKDTADRRRTPLEAPRAGRRCCRDLKGAVKQELHRDGIPTHAVPGWCAFLPKSRDRFVCLRPTAADSSLITRAKSRTWFRNDWPLATRAASWNLCTAER